MKSLGQGSGRARRLETEHEDIFCRQSRERVECHDGSGGGGCSHRNIGLISV